MQECIFIFVPIFHFPFSFPLILSLHECISRWVFTTHWKMQIALILYMESQGLQRQSRQGGIMSPSHPKLLFLQQTQILRWSDNLSLPPGILGLQESSLYCFPFLQTPNPSSWHLAGSTGLAPTPFAPFDQHLVVSHEFSFLVRK